MDSTMMLMMMMMILILNAASAKRFVRKVSSIGHPHLRRIDIDENHKIDDDDDNNI